MFLALYSRGLFWLLCLISITVNCQLSSEIRDFKIVKSGTSSQCTDFSFETARGSEPVNHGFNRLSMLSEDQAHYPVPKSACGPTAMLNILIWYEKFGLIPPEYRDADQRLYKLKLFSEIDRRLVELSGTMRTEEIGVRPRDTAIVMDSIVKERTKDAVRVHMDFIEAPLTLKDFFETTKNFRAGYLIVAPKNPETGKLLNNHAAVIIRTDRFGRVTLATWGQHYHGLFKKRYDGQWFLPQDPEHLELKIKALVRFTPFKPIQQ